MCVGGAWEAQAIAIVDSGADARSDVMAPSEMWTVSSAVRRCWTSRSHTTECTHCEQNSLECTYLNDAVRKGPPRG